MGYKFRGNIVKVDGYNNLERLLDCVLGMYLNVEGKSMDDIIKAFRDLGYLVEEDMLGKSLSQMPDYYLDYLFKILYGYDFNTYKNLN